MGVVVFRTTCQAKLMAKSFWFYYKLVTTCFDTNNIKLLTFQNKVQKGKKQIPIKATKCLFNPVMQASVEV